MSTRAIQDALQLLGFRDPVTDDVLSGGTVEFYSAGTLNAKNAWEEKEKTNAVTSVTLDSAGQAHLYFDGTYKFIVKNSSGTVKYTLDDLKYQARNTSTSTKSADYIADSDDDFILADSDTGAITITLPPVATAVAPITVKNIGSSSNDVTVTGNASETIDGLASVMLADSTSQQYVTDGVQWYGAGIATGTDYTSTTLVSGTNNSFDVASGITSVNVPDASNTVKGAIEIATDAEAVTGTAELLAVNPKQLKVVSDASIFTSEYISTGQTITQAGQLILPHSLGEEPKIVDYLIENTTNDAGYVVGDRVKVGYLSSTSTGAFSNPLVDATNITIRFANSTSVFILQNKTTGTASNLVNTSWQLYVKAWA